MTLAPNFLRFLEKKKWNILFVGLHHNRANANNDNGGGGGGDDC